jgi:hypothetical protein
VVIRNQLTVKIMQELSLAAPQHPKNATKNTTPPTIISSNGAVHIVSPGTTKDFNKCKNNQLL